MGTVWEAWDERLRRPVAIKRVSVERSSGIGSEPTMPKARRRRFLREARAAAQLNHPVIVQVFDLLTEDDEDWIVLELVEGQTLAQQLRDHGPLALNELLPLAQDLAAGLEVAHRAGLVHRDLKPSNVMITPEGRAKLLDFGLAKSVVNSAESSKSSTRDDTVLTASGMILGTVASMSPEQALGRPVDHRSDLFSLGLLLYEALSGTTPFLGETPSETLTRICAYRQPSLSKIVPSAPKALVTLLDDLLEKAPAHRPASAGVVLERLDALATTEELVGPRDSESPGSLPVRLPALEVETLDAQSEPSWLLVPPDPRVGTARADSVAPPQAKVDPKSNPQARSRWRRRLVLGLGGLVVLALLVVVGLRLTPELPLLHVAVPQPVVRTTVEDNPEVALLGTAVRLALRRGLLGLDRVSPIAFSEIDPTDGTTAEVSRVVAADEALVAELDCVERRCTVALSRQTAEGATVWADNFEVLLDGRLTLVERRVIDYVHLGYTASGSTAFHSSRPRDAGAGSGARAEDYREFLGLYRQVPSTQDPAGLRALVEALHGLHDTSPGFVEPYALEAHIRRRLYEMQRRPADLDAARAALRNARGQVSGPRDGVLLWVLQLELQLALEQGDLEAAQEAVESLRSLDPTGSSGDGLAARLLELQGQPKEALAQLRQAVARRPSVQRLFDVANMELRQGQPEAARAHLETLLRRDPNHEDGLYLLAQLELLSASPARAVELYRRLAEQGPAVDVLVNLGLAHLLVGDLAAAATTLDQAAALAPESPVVLLNQADATLLGGDRLLALERYRALVALIDASPERDTWQYRTMRAQALAHLGERREAIATIQRALQSMPESPQVYLEAALVYTVVGEHESALVNVERAMAGGVEPRWFTLPWFEPLRTDPEFRAWIADAWGTPSG